jgi:succinate dehydrogenase/fumarate reductase-like Fe-S protein
MTEGTTKVVSKDEAVVADKQVEEKAGTYSIYIMGKMYTVPVGLTIMKAIEYAGYQFIRSCGCRAGFCGACATVYRKEDDQKLQFALACQKLIEDGMYLVQIPFVPASKEKYKLEELKPDDNTMLCLYPEIARCVSCNTCTKSCPQDIKVMMYIQNSLRGDIGRAAELSFDCIQCGMCAMRCPADIKHYHVGQLARRLRGRYIDPESKNLKARLQEMEAGKYDKEIQDLMNASDEELKKIYSARKIEAKGELDDGAEVD